MNKSKRQTLKLGAGAVLLAQFAPLRWTTPVIDTVMLPAHAQTSTPGSCSAFDTEPVNEAISITITATEARGPLIAVRTGNTFSATQSSTLGPCGDNGDLLMQTIIFDGEIDSAGNSIIGNFVVNQTCGGEIVCDQVTNYMVMQVVPNSSSELGDFSGRAIGTLRCCVDLI